MYIYVEHQSQFYITRRMTLPTVLIFCFFYLCGCIFFLLCVIIVVIIAINIFEVKHFLPGCRLCFVIYTVSFSLLVYWYRSCLFSFLFVLFFILLFIILFFWYRSRNCFFSFELLVALLYEFSVKGFWGDLT